MSGNGVVDKLLILQERDCSIRRMNRELQDIPKRKEDIQSRLEEHRQALEEAKESLKHEQAKSKEIEVEIASRAEQINKYRIQQLSLKTNEEFKAMENEIKAVEDQIRGLEDQDIELMEEIEKAETNIREKEQALKEEEDSVNRDLAAMDQRSSNMESELGTLHGERGELAEGIDPEWLHRYTVIFENKKDKAIVTIENGVCSGCHMKVPPQLAHDVRKENTMVSCDYCGRLLCQAS